MQPNSSKYNFMPKPSPQSPKAYFDTTRSLWLTALRELPVTLAISIFVGIIYVLLTKDWNNPVDTLIVSLCIGTGISFSTIGVRWLLNNIPHPKPVGTLLIGFIGIPIGVLVGDYTSGIFIPGHVSIIGSGFNIRVTLIYLTLGLIGGTIGILFFTGKWRAAEHQRRLEQAQRAAAQANLRRLQAQVEPHFLFNTLANLDALIALDPRQARVLLGHLNRYLRNSLNHSRSEATTLRDEIEQLRAYLGIMEIRLPDRLQTSIDCPPDCAELPLAPMLLQPLVENAIKHGIEPSPRGGEIQIRARIADETLIIEVRDSGIGLDKAQPNETSNGTGIANIRERLEVLYGKEARLELAALPESGTQAMLRIPLASLDRKPCSPGLWPRISQSTGMRPSAPDSLQTGTKP